MIGLAIMFITLEIIREEASYCGVRGVEKDACPYRRPDRRAAWLQGWENGRQIKLAEEARAPLSQEEKAKNRARCQRLLAALQGE